jgi:hypothetical protein
MPSFRPEPGERAQRRIIDWNQPADAIVPSCPLRKLDENRTALSCETCVAFRGKRDDSEREIVEYQKTVGLARFDRAHLVICAMDKLPDALRPKAGKTTRQRNQEAKASQASKSRATARKKKSGTSETGGKTD